MKTSLNIIKSEILNGKRVLLPAIFAFIVGIFLIGCGSVDVIESTTSVSSEIVSEEVVEIVSEEISEMVSEEISEDGVAEEAYSAQEVMTLIDDLTAKYQYNDPEHIKALVIAANLDYITAEDLDVILDTYGYTMEELAGLYDDCILDNGASKMLSFDFYQGNVDTLPEDKDYDNRISLNKVMLSEEDKELAQWYDSLLCGEAHASSNTAQREEFVQQIQNCKNDMTYSERTMYSYACGLYTNSLVYTEYLENPYVYYISVNVK